MKKLIFIIPFLLISCVKKDITSIVIKDDQSSEINLFKGQYIVRFMNKKDANYNFSITNDEIIDIKKTYDNQNIGNYASELLITDNNEPIIMPVSFMIYIINFSDGSKQIFRINADLKKNPLEIEEYRELNFFIEKINSIIKSKKEIQNALKSDYKYM
jgi:hypothetical protein